MARLNNKVPGLKTHEGGTAKHINPELQLRRSVMACMLWEDNAYEDGNSIADRIKAIIPRIDPGIVASIAIEARSKMNLRHVPLLIVREMARLASHKHLVADTLHQVIQRPDELTEFLAIYWKDNKDKLSGQVKKGLASAFTKFNEYSLAKYNRDTAIKLRDVMFMCHPKPKDHEQEIIWRRLVDNELAIPDTWEVELSASKDKKASWERLLLENKLGGLALLRNLRNMKQAGVDEQLVFSALAYMKTDRILPFRFIAAARYAPQWEHKIEASMLRCTDKLEKLPGKTVLLVDVSGSMDTEISSKSEMNRMEAGCALAILMREICEAVAIYSFSDELKQIPTRRGFALRDAITNSQLHGATYLGQAVNVINKREQFDRIVVFTDEQAHDAVTAPKSKGYMVNLSNCRNGVGYGDWLHIDGFSEQIVAYIQEYERMVQE